MAENSGETSNESQLGETRLVPYISVIIPAHNEQDYIRQTLTSVRRQQGVRFEVIVVANGCSDRTAALVQGLCDKLVELEEKGVGLARNAGAKVAQGRLLVFLDADTFFPPEVLRIISQDFQPSSTVGTVRGLPDSDSFLAAALYWFKNFVHRAKFHCGSSGVIICRREPFFEAGGFDESLAVRENSDLIKRMAALGRYQFVGRTAVRTSMRRLGIHTARWLKFWFWVWLKSLFGRMDGLRGIRYEL